MRSGNDRKSQERDDLYFRPLVPIPLPPEILAQEKDIEAIFQHLISESRDLSEVREEQANAVWIGVVLLCLFFLRLWVLAAIADVILIVEQEVANGCMLTYTQRCREAQNGNPG